MTITKAAPWQRLLLWGGCGILVLGVGSQFLPSSKKESRLRRAHTAEVGPEAVEQSPLVERTRADRALVDVAEATPAVVQPPPAPTDLNHVPQAQRTAAMREAIAQEQRDAAWSPDSEGFIKTLLADAALGRGHVREIRCGGKRCGFAIDGIKPSAAEETPNAYAEALKKKLHERFKRVRMHISPKADGEFDVQVVAAREGYSMMGKRVPGEP